MIPTSGDAVKRLDQIEARIRAKHPRAAKDGELASLLNALRDEITPVWSYAHTGWSVHSGGPPSSPYWIAKYEDGVQVYIRPGKFRSLHKAQDMVNRLNDRDGIRS